jgi:hypothetical protein
VPLLALAVVLVGCPPPAPSPPPNDADATPPLLDAAPPDASLAALRACANLAMLGCPEAGPKCATTIDHVVASKLTPFDVECVAGAGSVDAVRLCPGIRCAP